ncbi:CsgG/HfaB family protein [Terasakiella sp.]|uniref:CsgG/HfaB family protein n=1 Tax=Terasakiella sp. TaxID=2034861 RepID=UPI003AA81EBA
MKKILGLILGVSVLTGCNAHQAMAPKVEVSKPVPVTKFSEYAGALEELGEMMYAYEEAPFVVMVEPIVDNTASGGKIPSDVTMLTESAIQNIGESVLLMPYNDNSVAIAQSQGKAIYAVHGAITEFDAGTTTKSSGTQLGFSLNKLDLDAGAESGSGFQSGTIAVDFLLLDMNSGAYVPGVKATAKAKLEKNEANQGFNFSILGNGFGLNGNSTAKSPVHHVINLMLEYSMAQLIGQAKTYPYWLAMKGTDPDYRVMRQMKRKFERSEERSQNVWVTYLLNRIDPSVPSAQAKLSAYTKQRISAAKEQFGIIPPDGSVNSEIYMKLLTDGVSLKRSNQTVNKADNLLQSAFK